MNTAQEICKILHGYVEDCFDGNGGVDSITIQNLVIELGIMSNAVKKVRSTCVAKNKGQRAFGIEKSLPNGDK